MRTAFSSAVPNHRRPGPVTRRNEVDRFSRSDSGGTVGYFVSPRLFSSQEESSRFYFPFFGGGENRRWLRCRPLKGISPPSVGQEPSRGPPPCHPPIFPHRPAPRRRQV